MTDEHLESASPESLDVSYDGPPSLEEEARGDVALGRAPAGEEEPRSRPVEADATRGPQPLGGSAPLSNGIAAASRGGGAHPVARLDLGDTILGGTLDSSIGVDSVETEAPPTPRPSQPLVSYDEFPGRPFRKQIYRPLRYSTETFAPVAVQLELAFPGEDLETATLREVSQTGFAFTPRDGQVIHIGDTIDQVRLRFDAHVTYDGRAQVRNVRKSSGVMVVGVKFLDRLLDIEAILALRNVKRACSAAEQASREALAEWSTAGQFEMRALIGELAVFLDAHRANFTSLEQALRWEEVHGDAESLAHQELIARIDASFAREYVDRLGQIDHWYRVMVASEGLRSECDLRLKSYAQHVLHPRILSAPLVHRMFTKPFRYAGDYMVMNYLYTQRFEGQTLYVKALHRATSSQEGGQAVRARKDLIRDRLLATATGTAPGNGRVGRALSVASGPAQEVLEFIERYPVDAPMFEFVLFDQDPRALAHAQTRLINAAMRHGTRNVMFRFLNDSIESIGNRSSILFSLDGFEVCYTAGLMDYLEQDHGRLLVQRMYELLTEEGTLLVGNFAPQNPSRWSMEHLYDWYLNYRSEDQLLDLAARVPDGAQVDILQERSGVNPFLAVQKR